MADTVRLTAAPAPAPAPAPAAAGPTTARVRLGLAGAQIAALWSLVKTRIAALVVVATALGFWVARGSLAPWPLFAVTVLGTALVCAGAGVLNNIVERDVDARMRRTRGRALPRGAVSVPAAVIFATVLTVAGAVSLAAVAGPLPAVLALAASVLYVLVYTPLKRVSWLNTPIGAVPGAIPPLIGWAAAAGALEPGAWLLFLVLLLWQHPHFYAIAWTCREDYRAAGLRMASDLDRDGSRLARQVVLFSTALAVAPLSLTLIGAAGPLFAVGSVVLGVGFLAVSWQFARRRSTELARRLLRASVRYLPALLLLLVADRLLPLS